MPEANVNTTELEVPQTMQLDMTPTPEQIKPEGEEGEAPPLFKDDVRDAIFAKRREMLTKEMSDQGLEPNVITEPEKTVEHPVLEQKIEQETKPEPVPEPKPLEATKTPEEQEFILKVYGKDHKLSKDELIREAQKGMAATQVFNEGYRMKEEALQIANAVKQNLQPQQVAKENPPQQPQSFDMEKDVAKRINYGSEDDQVKALRDYKDAIIKEARGQAPAALPPEQLIGAATQNAIAYIDARTEQETLRKEFADILADKPIASAADVIANELNENYRSQGITKSRLELFREAGTLAREKYLKPKIEETPVQPNHTAAPTIAVSNDKLERKRAAPKPPAAANKIAVEPPPQYGVGVSSIVNQMRKARGQPVFN